ncbi:MAG: phosphoribosylglycinamide formyltransferase [Pseudomonadota bacterium]
MSDARVTPLPVVILLSGNGSNLQAIIDATGSEALPIEIKAVISNKPQAFGLERAKRAGIATAVLEHTAFADRAGFDQALMTLIDRHQPRLVILAGFMRILTPEFVRHYHGRLLNIHPSLLPKYTGLDTHRRALAAGEPEHGASVHFVTEELDGGPVIIQGRVPVQAGDTPETLAKRVLVLEHRIYPLAIRWFAEGRVRLEGSSLWFDNRPLVRPITLDQGQAHPAFPTSHE